MRVVGALIEKQVTHAGVLSLTLNALMHACHQTSNREPVVAFDEKTIMPALEILREKIWCTSFMQRQPGPEIQALRWPTFSSSDAAGACGDVCPDAQRAADGRRVEWTNERLYEFADLAEVEATLEKTHDARRSGSDHAAAASGVAKEARTRTCWPESAPAMCRLRSANGNARPTPATDASSTEAGAAHERIATLEATGAHARRGIRRPAATVHDSESSLSKKRRAGSPRKLTRDFYERRDALLIARQLLGKRLVVPAADGARVAGLIVETEAYLGPEDKASHAYGNRRTKRTEAMFARGGTAYVYFIYGMYYQFNVVTNVETIPHAVLVRAIEPEEASRGCAKASRKKRTAI